MPMQWLWTSSSGARREHRRRPSAARRLLVESPETRLALSWTGIPPISISPPATAVQVSLNAQSDAQGSAAIASTEVDYYSFVAPDSGSFRLAAQTPASSLDPVLGLFNSAGQRLAYNDDFGGTIDSQLTASLTGGQRYYVGITNYTFSPPGSYTWTIDGPSPATDDALENNDTLATAHNLGVLTASFSATSLAMADGHDWYRFQTNSAGTAASSVAIQFQHALGDLDMELVSASGARLGLSNSVSNSERISLASLPAGVYYVHVYGYLGASNPSYSLTIAPPVAAPTPPTPPTPPTTGPFHIDVNMSGMTISQQAIFQEAANRWAEVIVGDLPNATYNGRTVDDLLIDARAISIDGSGGVLGQAAPDRFRTTTRLPYHGFMEFDTADLASMERSGDLFDVILHEMGHVLGIGTIWQSLGLLSGAGGSNPRFTGSQATAAYNQIFGRSESSVPVENSGGAGTRDGHWRESVFGSELMTGYIGPGSNIPLSRITVGAMADVGYQVNFAAADAFVPPASAARVVAGAAARQPALAALIEQTIDTPLALWPSSAPGVKRGGGHGLGPLASTQVR